MKFKGEIKLSLLFLFFVKIIFMFVKNVLTIYCKNEKTNLCYNGFRCNIVYSGM